MPAIFVRDPHCSSREKLDIPGDLDSETIESLKRLISGKVGLESENFILLYGGRVLKPSKTLTDYKIIDGVTVFYLKKQEQKQFCPPQSEHFLKIKALLRNPRIFRVVKRLIMSPSLLESMLKNSTILSSPGVQMFMKDTVICESTKNPESLIKAFESRPEQTQAVADILELLGAAVDDVSESTGYNLEEVEGQLGMMLDKIVVDGVDYFEEARESRQMRQETDRQSRELADAQEQMFLHSQALQAHQQNQSSTTSHQETEPMETSTESTPQQQPSNLSTGPPLVTQHVSRQASTGNTNDATNGITEDMLASALSSLQNQQSSIQLPYSIPSSSLQSSQVPMETEQQQQQQQQPIGRSSLPSGRPTVPIRGITSFQLMQALQSITRESVQQSLSNQQSLQTDNQQPPSSSSEPQSSSGSSSSQSRHTQQQHSSRSHHRSQRSDRHQSKYKKQLEQLKGMGLTDEAAILHALEATKGDINAALELLIGGGNHQ